jgi:hypothetical protein
MHSKRGCADEVYQFLTEILPTVRQLGNPQVTRNLEDAILHFIPPITSEFLGKSMVALRQVVDNSMATLPPLELQKASDLAAAIKEQWFSGHDG